MLKAFRFAAAVLAVFLCLNVAPTNAQVPFYSGPTVVQNAAAANGNGTILSTPGYVTALVDIVCSVTCSGGTAFNFEGSIDGVTYTALNALNVTTSSAATTATAPGDWLVNVIGYADFRVRISGYSAGTATVKVTLVQAGGGTGGGGGGGAATIANGADVVEGSITDSASCASPRTVSGCLAQLDADVKGAIPAGTNVIGGVFGNVNVTPTACSGTIATGGTAQNAFTAGATKHGFTIANIDTTEVMWISFTTTAAASGTDSFPLAPATATTFASLSSFTSPFGFGISTALSIVAATTSHKFSCTWW